MSKFRISEALMAIYRLFWDDFSSWYLEMIKPAYGEPIAASTLEATLRFFSALLKLMHPFMPFITEELWQNIAERRPGESIMYSTLSADEFDIEDAEDAIVSMENVKEIITAVRAVRAQKGISPRETLALCVVGGEAPSPEGLCALVSKMANLSEIRANCDKDASAASFLIGTREYNVPLEGAVDVEAESARLTRDIEYYEGFLSSVMKKLSNERFTSKAPAAVVDAERRKQADAEQKLASLRASLESLKK